MNFFRRMRDGFARFMYGRNGMDQLNLTMLWACIILELISGCVVRRSGAVGSAMYYVSLGLWIWVLFRMFSRNLYKRQEENRKFLLLRARLRSGSSGARARHADKEHKYFTCKSCKAICRVPVGKGKIVITCPKCGAQIRAKT